MGETLCKRGFGCFGSSAVHCIALTIHIRASDVDRLQSDAVRRAAQREYYAININPIPSNVNVNKFSQLLQHGPFSAQQQSPSRKKPFAATDSCPTRHVLPNMEVASFRKRNSSQWKQQLAEARCMVVQTHVVVADTHHVVIADNLTL